MYEIKIENSKGTSMTRKVYAVDVEEAMKPNSIPTSAPDLSGFKDENTYAYYVTYDDSGNNERIGDKIQVGENGEPTNTPTGWYNYQNRVWANIVTASEELTDEEKTDITKATNKNVAYWVWIPRYEYKIIDSSKEPDYIEGDKVLTEIVLINFIDTSKITPTEGYKIPESFKWGEDRELSGYWVSKYEVSDVQQ